MQIHQRALVLALAAAGVLSGCGGDGGGDVQTPTSTRLSGVVSSADGAPLSGIRVIVEDRTTDETYTVLTGADGSFSTDVNPGVYDVLFDDPDQMNVESLQRTAVDLRSDQKTAVQLQSAHALAANRVVGTATDAAGAPAADRMLIVLPTISRAPADLGDVPLPALFMVQTDAQGRFSLNMGQAGLSNDFDLLVLKPGAPVFDWSPLQNGHEFNSQDEQDQFHQSLIEYLTANVEESIDIEKPDGAMQVAVLLGTGVRNLRGASGAPSLVPADAKALAEQPADAGVKTASLGDIVQALVQRVRQGADALIPSAYAGVLIEKFDLHSFSEKTPGKKSDWGELINGRIDVADGALIRIESLIRAKDGELSLIDPYFAGLGFIHLHNHLKFPEKILYNNQIVFNSPRMGRYKFTDRTGDTYYLMIINTDYRHTVSFRSKKPDIVKIGYDFSLTRPQGARPPQ